MKFRRIAPQELRHVGKLGPSTVGYELPAGATATITYTTPFTPSAVTFSDEGAFHAAIYSAELHRTQRINHAFDAACLAAVIRDLDEMVAAEIDRTVWLRNAETVVRVAGRLG